MTLSQTTKQILKSFNIWLNKDLGQHFMIDQSSVTRIIEAADISKDDLVLEIGTGIGTLTKDLCQKAGFVITNEYDKKFIPVAKEYLKGLENFELVEEDFLKIDLDELFSKYKSYKIKKVVANLPYYITTPIISKLIEHKASFNLIVMTIQREFAHRIVSKPSVKEYGSFTIFANYHCKPMIVCDIPKSSFFTQPAVGSSVLRLEVLDKPSVEVKDEKLFFNIVHAAFIQRRKMLKNAIENANIEGINKENISKAFEKVGIDGKRRGETLSIEEFAKLSDSISSS
ncbi:16S rRNA (adenine(1518)-N(6)/adenine(1519)-N(6))-dimethyltransferase RsmA [Candidatus Margulisiibacteriota bacterium]